MIEIVIRRKEGPPVGLAQPPAGYRLFTVKRWGADARFVAEGDFDTTIRGEIGQFQAINLVVYGRGPGETVDRWSGDLSLISQFNTMTHADAMKLANMQLIPFGYKYGLSEAELLAVKDVKLRDGYTLHQKMNWLINPEGTTTKPSTVMWANGFWYEATWVRFGTMVHGGQMVAASEQVYGVKCALKNMTSQGIVECRKIIPFRRADWGRTHEEYPWLLQYATVANHPGNGYGEYIRGHVMCPVALASNEFDFAGTFQPTTYYIPAYWLV